MSRLVARYRDEGEAAFEPRSRRPHSNPNQLGDVVNNLIVNLRDQLTEQGLDAGPDTIAWHLEYHHHITVSVSTIRRRLIAAGRITPQPRQTGPAAATSDSPRPSKRVLAIRCHLYLLGPWRPGQSNRAEILTWLDDHSRYAVSVTAQPTRPRQHRGPNPPTSRSNTRIPRLHPHRQRPVLHHPILRRKGGRNQLETFCVETGSTRNTPDQPTPGRAAKSNDSNKPSNNGYEPNPTSQQHVTNYKPCSTASLPSTTTNDPTAASDVEHQPLPTPPCPKPPPTTDLTNPHHRIRHDHIDTTGTISLRRAGRMHHIGIGRPLAGTPVVLIIADLDIRVINTQTSELLRTSPSTPTSTTNPKTKKNPRTA